MSLNSENTKTPWVCYPFSAYDQAAWRIVEKIPPTTSLTESKSYHHVVIVGFGWFGERVALQVIRMCQMKSLGHEIVIDIIDNQAKINSEQFYRRYPAVDPENADNSCYNGYAPLAQLNFIQKDIQRMNEKALKKALPNIDENTVIYVCLADELIGTEAAISLTKITQESGARIVFTLPETVRFSQDMQEAFKQSYNIDMFFPLSESCTLAPNEKQLGEAIDDMGRVVLWAYMKRDKVDYSSMTLEERIEKLKEYRVDLHKNWQKLKQQWLAEPEWSRESNRQVACHLFFKLRLAGFSRKQIEEVGEEEIIKKCQEHLKLLAESEHDR